MIAFKVAGTRVGCVGRQAYSLQRFGGRPGTSAARFAGISQAVGLEMMMVSGRLTFDVPRAEFIEQRFQRLK